MDEGTAVSARDASDQAVQAQTAEIVGGRPRSDGTAKEWLETLPEIRVGEAVG